jgi:hypothetical protein
MGVSQPAVLTRGDQTIGGTKTFNGPAINLPPGAVASHLGFTPVQQGTGTGQLNNVVKIGWNGSALALQVDAVNMGTQWPIAATGIGMGGIGSYTWATNMGANVGAGGTVAGGALSPAMSGTWQNMTNATVFTSSAALWFRIA